MREIILLFSAICAYIILGFLPYFVPLDFRVGQYIEAFRRQHEAIQTERDLLDIAQNRNYRLLDEYSLTIDRELKSAEWDLVVLYIACFLLCSVSTGLVLGYFNFKIQYAFLSAFFLLAALTAKRNPQFIPTYHSEFKQPLRLLELYFASFLVCLVFRLVGVLIYNKTHTE